MFGRFCKYYCTSTSSTGTGKASGVKGTELKEKNNGEKDSDSEAMSGRPVRVLNVAEKNDAAKRIAQLLSGGNVVTVSINSAL